MTPTNWVEFVEYVAIDCDSLDQCVRLAALTGPDHASVVVNLQTGTTGISFSSAENASALSSHHPPDACIEYLRIRPLLFNTAWRVLDLLIETALNLSGMNPTSTKGWKIEEKGRVARRDAESIRPDHFAETTWRALLGIYDRLKDLRDSLVHRRSKVTNDGSIIGLDHNGGNLQPLTMVDLDALIRVALRAVEHVRSGPANIDERTIADLVGNLRSLDKFHGEKLPDDGLSRRTPSVRVIAGSPDSAGQYEIPIPHVIREAQATLAGFRQTDILIDFVQHPGITLRGRLESAPPEAVLVNPLAPPPWLSL